MLIARPPPSVPGCPKPSFVSFKSFHVRRCGCLIRAFAYSKKPTDTPGADQLAGDEKGEDFFVLGCSGEEPSVPTKEVLRWTSTAVSNSGTTGDHRIIADGSREKTTRKLSGFSGSFNRLKVQNVRELINKSSQNKPKHSGRTDQGSQNVSHVQDKNLEVYTSVSKDKEALANNKLKKLHRRFSDAKDSNSDASFLKTRFSSSRIDEKDDEAEEPLSPRLVSSMRGWATGNTRQDNQKNLFKSSKWNSKVSAEREFFSRKSFKSLGCSEDMVKALMDLNILRPSHIQALSYLPVYEGKTCILAEQSGSGKTLAYISPVIQRLREEELQGVAQSLPSSPRVVVLVPTAELASQVLHICRSISRVGIPFRSVVATGGFKQKTQLDNLREDVDVLVATPGRFMFLLQEGFLHIDNLMCTVLDEVDVLFGDDDFEQVLQLLIKSAPVSVQYIFVTATLPVDIYNKLVEVFPDCKAVMGPGLHRTNSGLEEILVDCSGDDKDEKTPETAFLNKKSALFQLLEESPVSKTIIFCNKIETCRKVENVLHRYDRKGTRIRVLPFHAALTQDVRLSNMREFRGSQSTDSLFLICTDRASRGIDFEKVDHVVLFDFPRDPSEYVRRVGRTARGAGGEGKAFVFVVGKQVPLARKIIERNKKGHPLHTVPSAYELAGSVV